MLLISVKIVISKLLCIFSAIDNENLILKMILKTFESFLLERYLTHHFKYRMRKSESMYHHWTLLVLFIILIPNNADGFTEFLINSNYTDQDQRTIQSSISLAVDTDTNLLYACVTYSQLSADDSITILINDSSSPSSKE